jgi:hippurate hydrolase
MCGHDGHVTCLLGFVPLFLKEIDSIPKNKSIKLFFQPSE